MLAKYKQIVSELLEVFTVEFLFEMKDLFSFKFP